MLIVSLLAFFLVAFGLTGAAVWFLMRRPSLDGEQTLSGLPLGEFEANADSPNLLRSDRVSSIGPWESMLQRFHFAADWKSVLAEADVSWSVGRLAAMMLLSGTLVTVALWRLPWVPMTRL